MPQIIHGPMDIHIWPGPFNLGHLHGTACATPVTAAAISPSVSLSVSVTASTSASSAATGNGNGNGNGNEAVSSGGGPWYTSRGSTRVWCCASCLASPKGVGFHPSPNETLTRRSAWRVSSAASPGIPPGEGDGRRDEGRADHGRGRMDRRMVRGVTTRGGVASASPSWRSDHSARA